MQPATHLVMSRFPASKPHSSYHTQASWLRSSPDSHHQLSSCNSSRTIPSQSSSPETTMVDFDVLLQRSSSVPANRLPCTSYTLDHEENLMDSLGSFKSVLLKGNQSLHVRTHERGQVQSREHIQFMSNTSHSHQIPLSQSMVKHGKMDTSSHRVGRSKPPTQPRDSQAKPPDQVGKTRAEIRRARAARNRSSARRSRLRKKAENQRDMEQATLVQRQNESLKHRLNELKERVMNLQKVANALGLADGQHGNLSAGAGTQMEFTHAQR